MVSYFFAERVTQQMASGRDLGFFSVPPATEMVSYLVSHGIAFGIVLFCPQMASGRQKIALVSQYRRYRIFLHVYKEKKIYTERTTKNFPIGDLK